MVAAGHQLGVHRAEEFAAYGIHHLEGFAVDTILAESFLREIGDLVDVFLHHFPFHELVVAREEQAEESDQGKAGADCGGATRGAIKTQCEDAEDHAHESHDAGDGADAGAEVEPEFLLAALKGFLGGLRDGVGDCAFDGVAGPLAFLYGGRGYLARLSYLDSICGSSHVFESN